MKRENKIESTVNDLDKLPFNKLLLIQANILDYSIKFSDHLM